MAKENEINYVKIAAETECVPLHEFSLHLAEKPFSDVRCSDYLMDIAQILHPTPAPPAKLLDVSIGSGWTSKIFNQRGYEVLGIDISPDMIDLAKNRSGNAKYLVLDYESNSIPGRFDVAVIYDA